MYTYSSCVAIAAQWSILSYMDLFDITLRKLQLFFILVVLLWESTHQCSIYAANFEEVEEAYWFGPVRLSVTLALGQEPLEIGS